MPAITQRIDNYLGGVSRQSDDKKKPGQVKECLNGYPDPTFGLTKRPGFKWIKNLGTGTTYDDSKWFYIARTSTERYVGCIKPAAGGGTGDIDIWNVDGTVCTVSYDATAAWAANTAYAVGVRVTNSSNVYQCLTAGTSAGAGGPTGTTTPTDGIVDNTARWTYISAAAGQSYLTGGRLNYQVLTVQDTSIITNNLKINRKLDIASGAAKRRREFESLEYALSSYKGRGAFATWGDEWISSYLLGGTEETKDGNIQLTCAPEWESATFRASSMDTWKYLKKIKIPSEVVYAEASHTYSPRARKEIDRLGKNWNSKCYNDATHFLPMEKADSVTEDIIKYIKDFL